MSIHHIQYLDEPTLCEVQYGMVKALLQSHAWIGPGDRFGPMTLTLDAEYVDAEVRMVFARRLCQGQ